MGRYISPGLVPQLEGQPGNSAILIRVLRFSEAIPSITGVPGGIPEFAAFDAVSFTAVGVHGVDRSWRTATESPNSFDRSWSVVYLSEGCEIVGDRYRARMYYLTLRCIFLNQTGVVNTRFNDLQIWYIDHHIGLCFKAILTTSDTNIKPHDALPVSCSSGNNPEDRSRLKQRGEK